MDRRSFAAPIIAVILLLLPALYVGSYVALVRPNCRVTQSPATVASNVEHYRLPGRTCAKIFWPLEQVDRQVRPGRWDPAVLIELERINAELRASEESIHGAKGRFVPDEDQSE